MSIANHSTKDEVSFLRPMQWVRRTGMSKSDTYRHIYGGRLRAVKVGRAWFIRATELSEFFDRMNENEVA